MRSSIMLATALAATAFAKPLAKRDVVVTQVDVVYTTDVVTVTAGQAVPSAGHKHHHHHSSASAITSASTSSSAAPPPPASTSSPAPVQPITTSTTQAQAPAPAPTKETNTAPAPETTGTYGGSSTATNYQQAVINHHNYHRQNHSASPLSWSQEMADIAMSIAQTCIYAHNMTASTTPYGQNIAAGVGASDVSGVISDMFYNGEVSKFTYYGQAQPDMNSFEGWGHFSQIVWASTTQVGCATWNCGSSLKNFNAPNGYFTVCNYSPPGNYGGQYAKNIGDSLNQQTVPGSFNVNTNAIGQSYCDATGQPLN